MRKLFLLLLCICSLHSFASLRINEVMPCNLSTYLDEDFYNFSGYVELYNDGKDTISLLDCQLLHYNYKKKTGYNLKWNWTIEENIKVYPNSYRIIWFDEESKKYHSPYKLDADGGSLALYKDDVLLDSLAYDEQKSHLSFGYDSTTLGYMEPSPLAENTKAFEGDIDEIRCDKPDVDKTPGLVDNPFHLTLTSTTPNASIYYTTNGKFPSKEEGIEYNGPIYIAKNCVIRARAYCDGSLPSAPYTATYIFNDDQHDACGGFTIPIVSIVVDSTYFYSDKYGICVTGTNGISGEKNCTSSSANYNRDWKRPVSFEYIVDGQQVLSHEAEVEVVGGCSRTETVKSLSIKASKKTGKNKFDYYFFKSKPNVTHQTLHLRNGGTAYNKVRFRDGLMQTFAIGMNIDYQAYQPVAYYINGKYIGLMNLNERTNADYVKANYDIDEEDIDLITVSDQLGINASKGDLEAYDELVSYLKNNDASTESYYNGACERMDMDEYMDYQVFQQFIVNTDWPGNNTKIWRERVEGSKFRWILFDTDFGFQLPGYEYLGGYSKNMFNWCQGTSTTQWANRSSWMTVIFKQLSKNDYFRYNFVQKYKKHLSTTFSNQRIETVFDSLTSIIDAEYCAMYGESATTAAESMRNFALKRAEQILSQAETYLGDVVINTTTTNSSSIASDPLVLVYPNPTTDYIFLMSDAKINRIRIFTMTGSLISTETVNDTYYEKDMSSLPKGFYLLRIDMNDKTFVHKIELK